MHKLGLKRTIGVVLIVLTIGLSAIGYFNNTAVVTQNPQDVFWRALLTTMSTDGITCTVQDNTSGRESTQKISLDLKGKTGAVSSTTLSQDGSTVITEGVTTKTDEYVRHKSIHSTQKDSAGKPLNFSGVLNVWGQQAHEAATASLFEQTALGGCVVPLGGLSAGQATNMLTDMQKNKVFQTDLGHPKHATDDGAPVLEYTVTVPPAQYVPFMKRFAAAYGLQGLSTVNASSYNGQAPKSLVFDIAPKDASLRKVSFTGQNHSVTLTDYGKQPRVVAPSSTIALSELQQRLQSVK